MRLHIARLIAALIATGSSEVRKELAALGTLNILLVNNISIILMDVLTMYSSIQDMMVEFSHNNFLHSQIERSIQNLLGLETSELIQTTTTETEITSNSDRSTCPLLVNVGINIL